MKHIGFDESTVLNEFARIATEKGLVKNAASPADVVEAAEGEGVHSFEPDTLQPLDQQVQTMDKPGDMTASPTAQWLAGVNAKVQQKAQSATPIDKTYWAAVANYLKSKFNEQTLSKPLDDVKQELVSGAPKGLGQGPQEFMSMLGGFAGSPVGGMMLSQKDEDGMMGMEASKEEENVKQAAGERQVYDVSGETGEQLVEKAHPGGGTKTELTHSKTDENLVETIVEQQNKDIDVAHSVPKGTYAALVDLYMKLHKMGHGEKLASLKKTISKVSTREEHMVYTLNLLADKLDKMGHTEAADKVDSLIVVAQDDQSSTALAEEWAALDAKKKQLDQQVQTIKQQGLTSIIQKLQQAFRGSAFDNKFRDMGWAQGKDPTQLRNEVITMVTPDTSTERGKAMSRERVDWAFEGYAQMFDEVSKARQRWNSDVQNFKQRQMQAEEAVSTQTEEEKGKAGTDEPKETEQAKDKKKTIWNDWKKAERFRRWFAKRMLVLVPGFEKSELRITRSRPEDGVTPAMTKDMRKAINYMRKEHGGWKGLDEAYKAKMSGKAGAGEQRPPEAPRSPADKEVVKEQAINKMYEIAARGLTNRGYPVEDISEAVMDVIRKHMNTRIQDVTNPEARKQVWQMIKRDLNRDYPKKG